MTGTYPRSPESHLRASGTALRGAQLRASGVSWALGWKVGAWDSPVLNIEGSSGR